MKIITKSEAIQILDTTFDDVFCYQQDEWVDADFILSVEDLDDSTLFATPKVVSEEISGTIQNTTLKVSYL